MASNEFFQVLEGTFIFENIKATSCVWLDTDMDRFHDLFKSKARLRQVTCHLATFADVDECINYITDITNQKVCFIVSRHLSKQIIPLIYQLEQIKSFYVFTSEQHDAWRKSVQSNLPGIECCALLSPDFPIFGTRCGFATEQVEQDKDVEQLVHQFEKVVGIYSNINLLCRQLSQDIKLQPDTMSELQSIPSLQGSSLTEQNNKQETTFIYFYLLKDILIGMHSSEAVQQKKLVNYRTMFAADSDRMKEAEELEEKFRLQPDYAKRKLIENGRQSYANDHVIMSLIDEFERNYCSMSAISWYTKHAFIFESVNSALRAQDIVALYSIRFFLADLHYQIKELQMQQGLQSKPLIVYRGQGMLLDEFLKHRQNAGGLLSVCHFWSTSRDREVAIGFAPANSNRPGIVPVLFQLETNSTSNCVYADISDWSHFSGEQEIIFSMGSVFRIDSIEKVNNYDSIWQFNLKLTGDEDEELKMLRNHIRSKLGSDDSILTFAKLLLEMDEIYVAEHFYKLILEEALYLNDPDKLRSVYYTLGSIYCDQENYPNAFGYYHKALENLSKSDPLFATIRHSEGMCWMKSGVHFMARKYFEEALEADLTAPQSPQTSYRLGVRYNSLAVCYQCEGNYIESMNLFNIALTLKLDCLPPNHWSVAITYSNIGETYGKMGRYQEAWTHLQKAFDVASRCLVPTDSRLEILRQKMEQLRKKMIGAYETKDEEKNKSIKIMTISYR